MPTSYLAVGDARRIVFCVTLDGVTVRDVSADTIKVLLRKPNGTVLQRTASGFETDGTDGVVFYDIPVDELDTAGIWQVRLRGTRTGVQWTGLGGDTPEPLLLDVRAVV